MRRNDSIVMYLLLMVKIPICINPFYAIIKNHFHFNIKDKDDDDRTVTKLFMTCNTLRAFKS